MDSIPYTHLDKGTFLVSSPDIAPGFFSRSVLLICEHTGKGSFALVVNKSIELELPEEVVMTEQMLNPHVSLRAGGPMQNSQMMLLHSSSEIPQQTIEVAEGIFLGGDLQFLHETVAKANGPHLLLCFGFTGWEPGQLEREFLDGKWFLCPASSKHLFETEPNNLWQVLLREMGGKYASLSMIPEDLDLN